MSVLVACLWSMTVYVGSEVGVLTIPFISPFALTTTKFRSFVLSRVPKLLPIPGWCSEGTRREADVYRVPPTHSLSLSIYLSIYLPLCLGDRLNGMISFQNTTVQRFHLRHLHLSAFFFLPPRCRIYSTTATVCPIGRSTAGTLLFLHDHEWNNEKHKAHYCTKGLMNWFRAKTTTSDLQSIGIFWQHWNQASDVLFSFSGLICVAENTHTQKGNRRKKNTAPWQWPWSLHGFGWCS